METKPPTMDKPKDESLRIVFKVIDLIVQHVNRKEVPVVDIHPQSTGTTFLK